MERWGKGHAPSIRGCIIGKQQASGRRYGAWQRAIALLLLVAFGLNSGCSQTEEERLKQQVNVVGTHFYLAFKLAFNEQVEGRQDKPLGRLLSELEQGLVRAEDGAKKNLLNAETAAAVAQIVSALWSLRQEGRSEVEKWRESKLAVLHTLPQAHAGEYSLPTEHAVLLLGLTIMRLHPKAPAPVPTTALLYEAYMLGDDSLTWPELDGLARAAQAITYAGEQYCDLATVSTARLELIPLSVSPEQLQALAGLAGLGRGAAHAPEAALMIAAFALAQQLPWAMRLLAFAQTARCLSDSSLPNAKERALVEWERAIGVAEQVGFGAAELGFLRAYLAYQRSDLERVQQELRRARESTLLTQEERTRLDELTERFDPNAHGKIDEFLDPLFVSGWVLRLVHHRLEAAGFYEQLAKIPVFELVAYVFKSAALPTPESAQRAGSYIWHWIGNQWQAWRK